MKDADKIDSDLTTLSRKVNKKTYQRDIKIQLSNLYESTSERKWKDNQSRARYYQNNSTSFL